MTAKLLFVATFLTSLVLTPHLATCADDATQPEVPAVSQMLPFLPAPPAGWTGEEAAGSTSPGAGPGFARAVVRRDYNKGADDGSPKISVDITATGKSLEWVHDLESGKFNDETTEGYRRSVMIDGYAAVEGFQKSSGISYLRGGIEKRFMFNIQSRNQDPGALRVWFKLIDWKKLAALKPAYASPAPTPHRVNLDELQRNRARERDAKKKDETAKTIAEATKERPYENSLGMKFVPVPGTTVLFSVWETRVKDFEAFAKATSLAWEQASFKQSDEHPAVLLTWTNAVAFCQWLTEHERKAGRIGSNQVYRLPSDREWSVAVGLSEESTGTDRLRYESIKKWGYPWGREWPPPKGAGNYAGVFDDMSIRTIPVGIFPANRYGIYDLGGNVWEWCEDWDFDRFFPDQKRDKLMRGASWFESASDNLLAANRRSERPNTIGETIGFRCVLGAEPSPQATVRSDSSASTRQRFRLRKLP